MFISLFSESTCVLAGEWGGAERERERERIPSRLHAVRAEPDTEPDPRNHEIMTWAVIKSQTLNRLSHSGAPSYFNSSIKFLFQGIKAFLNFFPFDFLIYWNSFHWNQLFSTWGLNENVIQCGVFFLAVHIKFFLNIVSAIACALLWSLFVPSPVVSGQIIHTQT